MAAFPSSFRVGLAVRRMFDAAVSRSRPFALMLVILLTAMFGYGQSPLEDPDELAKELAKLIREEPVPTELPDETMRQVLMEVLRQEVKPGDSKRVVLISEVGINEAWLPKINTVDFKLIAPRDLRFTSVKYYSFDQVRKKDDVYSILFLTGAHPDGHVGTYWQFRIEGNRAVSVTRMTDRRVFIDY